LGGNIDTMLISVHYAQQYVSTGRFVPIATLGAKRHALLPDVPMLTESGFPGLDIANWFGYVAPAGTPKAIVDRLSQEFIAALKLPQAKEKYAQTGDPYPAEPAELAERIRRDIDSYGAVIRAAVKKFPSLDSKSAKQSL
jgi:tripartite-type tricarboxylate transporter receptor subunit TctC